MSKEWCRNLFDKLSDNGLWAVPRTGMVFRKDQSTRTLVWVATFPPESPINSLQQARMSEFFTNQRYFADADIAVEIGWPIGDYDSFAEAEAALKRQSMRRVQVSEILTGKQ